MIDFWEVWFSSGRGVGNPTRGFIADSQNFYKWIYENEERKRCSFASVQPFKSYETPHSIEKTFYDFDCKEDPERAGNEAFDFKRRLSKHFGIEALIVFSGNKGYHVYAFLEDPFMVGIAKDHMKPVYDKISRMLLGNAEYETLDPSVIGDIAQLARIPFTHHDKTGKLCRPMDLKPLDHYREHGVSLTICKNALKKIGEEKREKKRPKPRRQYPRTYDKELRPCMKDALSRAHLSHKMRIALVAELHADGWGKERITNVFSGMVDFDRRKTEYQVNHLIKNGYTPFKCTTIQGLGECLLEKCPVYRRRNRTPFPTVKGWGVQR